MSQPTVDDVLARLDAGEPVPGVPAWLAQVAGVLFDGQDAAAAQDWARRLHGALAQRPWAPDRRDPAPHRRDPASDRRDLTPDRGDPASDRGAWMVPFLVVHHWHAHTVTPLLVRAGLPLEPVRSLHLTALSGEPVGAARWAAALEPAMRELYRRAYAYASAHATARASAHAYAQANGFTAAGAVEFADDYATLSTDANAAAFADANAIANARATAAAYANADEAAYAACHPFAHVNAYARTSETLTELADGLLATLTHGPP